MATQFFRMEPIHADGIGKLSSMYEHNYRIAECSNADPERKSLNEELVTFPEGIRNYEEFYETKLENPYYQTHKLRKNGVRALDIQMSHGEVKEGKNFDEKAWARQSVRYLEDTFGKENIASAVLHRDEKVSHIHAFVVTASDEHGISLHQFFPHRGDFIAQQDRYYEYIKDLGIERPIRDVKLEHKRIKEFWNNAIGKERTEISAIAPGESPEAYRQRVQAELNAERDRITHSEMQYRESLSRVKVLEEASRRQEERHQREMKKALDRIRDLEKRLGEAREKVPEIKDKSFKAGARDGVQRLLSELGCKSVKGIKRELDATRRFLAACEYVGESGTRRLTEEMERVIDAYESRDRERIGETEPDTRDER